MRILTLNAALSRCNVAVVIDQNLIAERRESGARGQASILPVMVSEVLRDAGIRPDQLDAVAATVGPGSFTGIRACLALGHGLALGAGAQGAGAMGAGVPLVGVTVSEALASSLPHLGQRRLWVAIDSRRGRVFLDQGDGPSSVALAALPRPAGPVAVAGDAAIAVAACLAARGMNVMLTDAREPAGRHIAVVAEQRLRGERAPLPVQPLYVDPPEVRLPPGGPRPPPLA